MIRPPPRSSLFPSTTLFRSTAQTAPHLWLDWKSKHNAGAGAGLLFQRSVELAGQDGDNAQAKRLVLTAKGAGRQADPIVLDGQFAAARLGPAEGDQNAAGAPARESVLESVRQEVVQDQSARDGALDAQRSE